MAKQLLWHLNAFILLLLTSCNSSRINTGEVNYLAPSEKGTILVSAAGYGTSKPDAIGNAESNAFNNLIFRGIPGSQHQLPMVQNEGEVRKQHSTYFSNLLDSGGYKTFMMTSEEQSGFVAARKNQKNILIKVKINVDALRRDMEQQGVIRKFGL
jgi:hypothetical protein